MNVTFQMIDGDQGLVERERQRLRVTDADKESTGQSWTLRHRDGIDGLISVPRLGQSLPHHRDHGSQMLARRQFRNDASIGLMGSDLRSDNVRKNLLARAHNGRSRL